LLNIALGGRLIADIPPPDARRAEPLRMDKAGELVHEVPLTSGSLLAKMVGKRILGVKQFASSGHLETGGTVNGCGANAGWNS